MKSVTESGRPIVREAIAEDMEAVAALMSELGYPVTPTAVARRCQKFSADHRTFVAEIDGAVAGFVGCSALHVYESDRPVCWIMALCVSGRFRRRGVGRALLETVDQWCCDENHRDVRVHSGEARTDAHAFYEACGFKRTGLRFTKSIS